LRWQRVFPFTRWLSAYRGEWLAPDAVVGYALFGTSRRLFGDDSVWTSVEEAVRAVSPS